MILAINTVWIVFSALLPRPIWQVENNLREYQANTITLSLIFLHHSIFLEPPMGLYGCQDRWLKALMFLKIYI